MYKIDYGKDQITTLFRKMFLPTVSGMLFSSLLIISDGILVGRGIGSDALAAINIVAPIWLFATGIGLMFGMGGSVVASLYLARNKVQEAQRTTTIALGLSSAILFLCSILVLSFSDLSLKLLGCTERLEQGAFDYLVGFIPFLATNAFVCSGSFFVRLDGAPKYAMIC